MRILIVDDLPTNLEMLKVMLERQNYDVITATSGPEALTIMEQDPIQLVVMDWMMPAMSGIEVVKILRERYTKRYIYILMLTAYGQHSDIVQGLEAGVDDYLTRPVMPRELIGRVNIGRRIIELENRLTNALTTSEDAKREWVATVDSIPHLVCLLDTEGRVLRANRTVENWGLCWIEEAKGQDLADLLDKVYVGAAIQFRELWPIAVSALKRGLEYESEIADDRTGHMFQVHYEPTDPFNEHPNQDSLAAISIQDITERKRLEMALAKSNAENERLLANILPQAIAERLKAGEESIAEQFDNVSVLFADLVGFTALAELIYPTELVHLLNRIFSAFDELVTKYQVEKIKTIGDAYMVVAGLPNAMPDHADRLVQLGLEMQRTLDEVLQTEEFHLNLRVGVDSGLIVAGVIGKTKFAYDLWGSVVNTAYRMQEYGKLGCVQISEKTYLHLQQTYHIEQREPIAIKGKGTITTYLVLPN